MFGDRFPAVTRLERLLEREADALRRGAMSEIVAELPRKEELLAELEAASDTLGARLKADPKLRKRLSRIKDRLAENGERVAKLGEVVSFLSHDMKEVQRRHSLAGIYGFDGSRSDAVVSRLQHLDREA